MKEISLTQGKVAVVDNEDFEQLNQHRWYASHEGKTFYAARRDKSKDRVTRRMHRVIMNAQPGHQVDHIDSDGLNNRKANLRLCSISENGRNRPRNSNNRSGYKGVHWFKAGKKWRASIHKNGEDFGLGYFSNPEHAALAYNKAARKLFGTFAFQNPVSD